MKSHIHRDQQPGSRSSPLATKTQNHAIYICNQQQTKSSPLPVSRSDCYLKKPVASSLACNTLPSLDSPTQTTPADYQNGDFNYTTLADQKHAIYAYLQYSYFLFPSRDIC